MRKLKLIMATLALILGWSNAWANQTLADNGVYYIQNVETGLFLSRGGSFGAHALVDNYGLAWRLSGTNGSIKLQMYDIYCEGFTSGGLGGDSYVDNGSPLSNWTLEGDANGYTIMTGTTYLTANGNTPGSEAVIDGDGTGNKTWILLNDAEHAAVLAAKTSAQESAIATTAGIDLGGSTLSAILSNTSNWRTSTVAVPAPTSSGVWTYTENRDQGGVNNYGDYGTELFNKSGKFTKTISGLENGIYKLTVKAMHRSTYPDPTWTVGESFTNHTNSYVLANGYYAQLKDWKSAAENTSGYNPDNTGQFKAKVEAGNYATDIYTYVSNGTLDITVSQEGFWYGEWFAFNGVTLTYYTDQVTDEDATAILETATEKESKAMLASVKSALTTAKTTFDGAHTIANYNALNTAIDNANSSIAAYAPLGTKLTEAGTVKSSVSSNSPSYVTTFDTNIAAITSDYNAGNYAESAISTQVAAVETEILKLVKSQTVSGSDMTRVIPNAACTAAVGIDNWKIETTPHDDEDNNKDEMFRLDTWAGTASGMSVPMIEYWVYNGNNLQSNVIYQTISGLQKGVYIVTATTAVNNESNFAPTAGSALLFANDETTDITTGGTETSFKGQTGTFSVSVVLTDADEGELKLGLKTVKPNYNWIALKNVTLTYYGDVATSDDYDALNAAISEKDVNTLGFETGEYAPYNNVEVLTALKNAKAINQDADNAHSIVVAATEALEAANWSAANASNVECVYNGDFSQGDWGLGGWTRTNGWGRDIPNDPKDPTDEVMKAAGATTGHAYYNQPGSLQYGNAGVYTMPLKANTIYNLTFKYASWADDSNDGMTVSVLNNEDGMAAMVFPENNTLYSESGAFVTKTLVFVTGAAGDYVLTLANNGNTVMTDVSITKAANQYLNFADGSVPSYAPGTYPSVKITRTLTANRWATAIYPFAVSGVDYLAVFDRYNDATEVMGFSSAAASTANKPFLMKSIEGTSEITLSNVAVEAINATDVTYGNASLKGVYETTKVKESDNAYVISENEIHPASETGATVNPYRAYIQVTGTGARGLSFVIDDEETTAIDGIETVKNGNMKVYNLNGQRVEKPGKGLYIVNGKKLLVK